MAAAALATAFAALLLVGCASATDYTVGDSNGWTLGANGGDYSSWASGKSFVVGDKLVFNYGSTHNVNEVSQSDYASCSTSNPLSSNSNSPTTIALTSAGTHYFTCFTPTHCQNGMKLAVTVAAAGSSSGTSSPSTPSTGGSTPPSGITTPAPATTGSSSSASLLAPAAFLASVLAVLAKLAVL